MKPLRDLLTGTLKQKELLTLWERSSACSKTIESTAGTKQSSATLWLWVPLAFV